MPPRKPVGASTEPGATQAAPSPKKRTSARDGLIAGPSIGGRPAPVDRQERWPLAKLVPYAKNPRLHSSDQVKTIAGSMREFGQTQLVVVDGDEGKSYGEIIAGHGRVMAARELGWTEIAVGIALGWGPAQKRAYRIADNQIALASRWDGELLSGELIALEGQHFDLSLLGFVPLELDKYLRATPANDPEAVPPVPATPTSKTGDVWILGKHRLLCGDSTKAEDVARALDGAKPNLMVTDPPYGVDYDPDWRNRADRANGKPYGASAVGLVQNDTRTDWRETWALFPGAVAYCWHADRHASSVQASLESSGFQIVCQVIWAKDRFIISRGDYHWQHEPCWYAVRKGKRHDWNGDRSQATLWTIPHAKSETGHSTQKPIECMRRPIENNSSRGDAVYEPFSGSGTTIIAAEMMKRHALAVEIDPGYVDVAVMRWQEFTGKKAILDGDGRSFDLIKRERSVRRADGPRPVAAGGVRGNPPAGGKRRARVASEGAKA